MIEEGKRSGVEMFQVEISFKKKEEEEAKCNVVHQKSL